MTKDEALRLALEALEEYTSVVTSVNDPNTWIKVADGGKPAREAITAIKAALEAKDEPVATKNNDGVTLHLGWDDLPVGTKLYATPPQRTWVGLTDAELAEFSNMKLGNYDLCLEVEAKLKEKNA